MASEPHSPENRKERVAVLTLLMALHSDGEQLCAFPLVHWGHGIVNESVVYFRRGLDIQSYDDGVFS